MSDADDRRLITDDQRFALTLDFRPLTSDFLLRPSPFNLRTSMPLALLSDIHANLPALEAVLADIDRRRPDAVYCLGDLVGYNTWPNEVVQTIRERGIPT